MREASGMPRRSRDRPIEAVPRRLLTRAEAAASLGMSIAHFERFVQPFVKAVPCGQLLPIEPGSLDRWVQEHARLASAVGQSRFVETGSIAGTTRARIIRTGAHTEQRAPSFEEPVEQRIPKYSHIRPLRSPQSQLPGL